MKRLCSTDSLGALMSICRTADRESNPRNCHVYGREFQSMLEGFDEEGCVEESVQIMGEKKRRLSVNQVKALEKNFEVENKLEPERKLKLAQELGLQPRQIAVWFQNRRARWKTKQLERDYALLKAKYDALNQNYESLRLDHEALLQEIRELKEKMNEEENSEGNPPVKDKAQSPAAVSALAAGGSDGKFYSSGDGQFIDAIPIFPDLKDGSSESDSSAILNEETHNSPSAAISSSAVLQNAHFFVSRPPASSLGFNSSSSSSHDSKDCFEFSSTSSKNGYQPPSFVKMEEHNFFGGEEECNFFSDEQAPTLHWYCPEQWN